MCVCVGLRAVVLEMMGHDGNEDVLPGGRENMNTFVKNTTPQNIHRAIVQYLTSAVGRVAE